VTRSRLLTPARLPHSESLAGPGIKAAGPAAPRGELLRLHGEPVKAGAATSARSPGPARATEDSEFAAAGPTSTPDASSEPRLPARATVGLPAAGSQPGRDRVDCLLKFHGDCDHGSWQSP
jgi:hypothetical protein